MKKTIPMVLVFLLAMPLVASTAGSAELIVAAAANLQFTLEELKAEFNKETGIDVKTVIGSSGQLTAQIDNGAPFDVFLSADMDYPKALEKQGDTLNGPKVYAYGVLVLWTVKDIDLSKGIAILADHSVKKVAMAMPNVAPYGRQAVNAMRYNHLYSVIESKLVYGQSISQTNQFITTGAVDVGLTAESVVLSPHMRGKGKWSQVDPKSYEPMAQGIVVLKYAGPGHLKAAREFYDFIFSAQAQEIFKKYGYKLP